MSARGGSKKDLWKRIQHLENELFWKPLWREVSSSSLPEPYVPVLCFDEKRGVTVGYIVPHPDLRFGRMWCINGSGGGIGTEAEVFPPTHWTPLPPLPGKE